MFRVLPTVADNFDASDVSRAGMYVRLARQEERDALATFGKAYANYAARVPAFLPRLNRILQQAS